MAMWFISHYASFVCKIFMHWSCSWLLQWSVGTIYLWWQRVIYARHTSKLNNSAYIFFSYWYMCILRSLALDGVGVVFVVASHCYSTIVTTMGYSECQLKHQCCSSISIFMLYFILRWQKMLCAPLLFMPLQSFANDSACCVQSLYNRGLKLKLLSITAGRIRYATKKRLQTQ